MIERIKDWLRGCGLCPYALIVPDDVIAYHAARSGLGDATIRATFRSYPPERQRLLAAMTRIEQAMSPCVMEPRR